MRLRDRRAHLRNADATPTRRRRAKPAVSPFSTRLIAAASLRPKTAALAQCDAGCSRRSVVVEVAAEARLRTQAQRGGKALDERPLWRGAARLSSCARRLTAAATPVVPLHPPTKRIISPGRTHPTVRYETRSRKTMLSRGSGRVCKRRLAGRRGGRLAFARYRANSFYAQSRPRTSSRGSPWTTSTAPTIRCGALPPSARRARPSPRLQPGSGNKGRLAVARTNNRDVNRRHASFLAILVTSSLNAAGSGRQSPATIRSSSCRARRAAARRVSRKRDGDARRPREYH